MATNTNGNGRWSFERVMLSVMSGLFVIGIVGLVRMGQDVTALETTVSFLKSNCVLRPGALRDGFD